MTKAHRMIRHLTEVAITPTHAKRTESAEFQHNKDRLKEDPMPQDGAKPEPEPEQVLEEMKAIDL